MSDEKPVPRTSMGRERWSDIKRYEGPRGDCDVGNCEASSCEIGSEPHVPLGTLLGHAARFYKKGSRFFDPD